MAPLRLSNSCSRCSKKPWEAEDSVAVLANGGLSMALNRAKVSGAAPAASPPTGHIVRTASPARVRVVERSRPDRAVGAAKEEVRSAAPAWRSAAPPPPGWEGAASVAPSALAACGHCLAPMAPRSARVRAPRDSSLATGEALVKVSRPREHHMASCMENPQAAILVGPRGTAPREQQRPRGKALLKGRTPKLASGHVVLLNVSSRITVTTGAIATCSREGWRTTARARRSRRYDHGTPFGAETEVV